MTLTRRRPSGSSNPLSPELEAMLRDGPWAVGNTLNDLPPHDELRRLWAVHGPAIEASMPRARRAWFLERDHFVRMVRGEPVD
jgi:hypothetical protein